MPLLTEFPTREEFSCSVAYDCPARWCLRQPPGRRPHRPAHADRWTNVEQIGEADRTGKLGSTWIPLVDTIEAVDTEQDVILLNSADETQRARLTTDDAFADSTRR